jgi:hypothetical protein
MQRKEALGSVCKSLNLEKDRKKVDGWLVGYKKGWMGENETRGRREETS